MNRQCPVCGQSYTCTERRKTKPCNPCVREMIDSKDRVDSRIREGLTRSQVYVEGLLPWARKLLGLEEFCAEFEPETQEQMPLLDWPIEYRESARRFIRTWKHRAL